MQNIGAYGVEIKDTFINLEAFEINSGKIAHFNAEDCQFGYRESVFKNQFKNQYVILNISLRLNKNPAINTSYGDINSTLESKQISNPTIKDFLRKNLLIKIIQIILKVEKSLVFREELPEKSFLRKSPVFKIDIS